MIKISRKYCDGSSLVETLIALLITAIGLLGVLSMQAKAIQLNHNAYHYSQAAILANDMMESIKQYPSVAPNVFETPYSAAASALPTCAREADGCGSASEVASWSLSRWKQNLADRLPSGRGEIVVRDDIYAIRVQFQIGTDLSTGAPLFNNPPVEIIARR